MGRSEELSLLLFMANGRCRDFFGVFMAALFFRYVDIAYLAIFLGAKSFIIGVKFFVERAAQNTKNNAPIKPSNRNWTRMIGLNSATGFTSFFLMGESPIQMFWCLSG